MAVAGHMTGLEAPDWSNKVLIDMSEVGSHLCWLQLQFDGVLFWNWGVFLTDESMKTPPWSQLVAVYASTPRFGQKFWLKTENSRTLHLVLSWNSLHEPITRISSFQLWSCCWMSRWFVKGCWRESRSTDLTGCCGRCWTRTSRHNTRCIETTAGEINATTRRPRETNTTVTTRQLTLKCPDFSVHLNAASS